MKLRAVITGLVCVTSIAHLATAQPTNIVDEAPASATHDGAINGGEYAGFSVGINDGFGNVLGSNSSLHVNTAIDGTLNIGFVPGPGAFDGKAVIYIDSLRGGVVDTTTLTDTGDQLRALISGSSTNGSADLFFAPGFQPDFAIGLEPGFAGLWELRRGLGHVFLGQIDLVGAGTFELELDLQDIALAPGNTFTYMASYADPNAYGGGYVARSDEFHGVAQTTVPGGNPDTNALALAAGDFNTFTSYGDDPPRGPIMIVDGGFDGATNDGTIVFSEYAGFSLGINRGFADVWGNHSRLYIDSDRYEKIYFGLSRGPGGFADHAVIYIDSEPGGPPDTRRLVDTGDDLRAMISGTNVNGSADLTFAPGFAPDYAIGINVGFAGLWQIREAPIASLPYSGDLEFNTDGTNVELTVAMSDIGLKQGETFTYFLTYGNAFDTNGVFRSDEFHGVAPATVTNGNLGQASLSLAEGDYNTFTTVTVPTVLSIR